MARIRFLSDQIYDTGAPGRGPRFPSGHVLDASGVAAALGLPEVSGDYADGFLHRWVRRGVAEYVDGRTPVTADEVEKAEPPAPPVVSQPLGSARRGTPTVGLDAEDAKPVQTTDLTTLTRAELDAIAKKRGIDVSDAKNKGDVIAAIELADEAEAGAAR